MLEVVEAPGLITVQDAGRPGRRDLGVPASGALDGPAHRLANRLVGNHQDAATLELGITRLGVRAVTAVTLAVTGAPRPLSVDGGTAGMGCVLRLHAGQLLQLGPPVAGVYSYVAVRGGIAVPPELGSRSTDLLSGLGPAPLRAGDLLPVGADAGPLPDVDAVALARVAPPQERVVVRITVGPRADWCGQPLATLGAAPYLLSAQSNRVGLRFQGAAVSRIRSGELPSEGLLPGAVQIPPDGQPIVFLADAPTTGGYPVVAVVVDDDLAQLAQVQPGSLVVFRPLRG